MRQRPRLLMLCQTVPYPPDGGVWIRTFHVMRLLSSAFDVTALCFERAVDGEPSERRATMPPAALSALGRVEVFTIPQRHSRVRFAWDHVRSAVRGRVYTRYVYDSRAFTDRLRALVNSGEFDLVHIDSLVDLVEYVPLCAPLPTIAVHHAVESELLRRRGDVEPSAWRRRYLHYQAGLLAETEREWCPRVALNVAVSRRERDALSRMAPGCRAAVVPNGVDIDEFHPDGQDGSGLAYIGGAHWGPNLDALNFFCEDILPHLGDAGVRTPVRWIGRASLVQQRQYAERYGVELTGHVEDVKPLMHAAACHVVPLRAGGGTRLKILNSWAMGKPVVSTSLGCEGLDAVDGDNILIRDDPKDFAHAVMEVLGDEALRRTLGAGGRQAAERTYSWSRIGAEMIDMYLRVANHGRGTRPGIVLHTFRHAHAIG